MPFSTTEVAPGIVRIESVLGPRPFAQYLLRGERTLLVDTGVTETPDDVILPAFRALGLDPAALDYVLISHADADHFGGNEGIRRAAPRAILCAHAADGVWIGDRERIVRERYGWYADHGPDADYDAAVKTWQQEAMGADVPVDLLLTGGERFRLGPALTVEVLHLPGHTAGHLGLWDPTSRTAIVTDAAMGSGLLDHAGTVVHPPPYFDVAAYEASAKKLRALAPARLLTAHYPVIEGAAVDAFLADTVAFIDRVRQATRRALQEEREATLGGLLSRLNPELGPFTSMPNELCGPIRAHLGELVVAGEAEPIPGSAPPAWRAMGAAR
jgi:glyoxylase-like metal-dependent hydrolase (beta-lactamase superfamily II)